jgi:arylsulfatase A-like enzyme
MGSHPRILHAALCVAFVAVVAGWPGAGAVPAQAPAQEQLNVVVLMTDDQSLQTMRALPRTRALIGGQGATFTRSFVNYSRCCPSRATFLTGQYMHNHGVFTNDPPFGGYQRLDTSSYLPGWLQEAGYRTVHIGKFLNGYGRRLPEEVPPGWSEWYATVDPTSYRYWGYRMNENSDLRIYGRARDANYSSDQYSARAVETIERLAPDAEPFFLSVAFLAPHTGSPFEPGDPGVIGTPAIAPRHRGTFGTARLPRPPGFNERDVSDKPWSIRHRPRFGPRLTRAITALYRQQLASLLAVDEGIVSIVDALRDSGELDRTLILFTSDNGYFAGQHRVAFGKNLHYEPSTRVPLMLRGPGVQGGQRLRQLVTNADLAPTVLEAAGLAPRPRVDGRSLLPLARDPGLDWDRDLLIQSARGKRINMTALRSRRYMYVEYDNGEQELYDTRLDPYQLHSRHAAPGYARLRARLARRLRSLRSCSGRTCAGPLIRRAAG